MLFIDADNKETTRQTAEVQIYKTAGEVQPE